MRFLIPALFISVLFVSCSKDDYTSEPQITFRSITPAFESNNPNPLASPILTISVTDAEGDFGFEDGQDTSYVFVKNLTVAPFKVDSFKFPAVLSNVAGKNFKADLEIALRGDGSAGSGVLDRTCTSGCTDTLYFEVYVKDFAKHKSNVIRSAEPLLYVSP